MPRKILVFELCSELEQELIRQQLSEDTLKRYRKVLKFKADGGISITDEHSRNETYYFKCIRILAEYYNFGIIHTRTDFRGELIWPEGFRSCTERYFESLVSDRLSYGYINNSKKVIKDLILYLDEKNISAPVSITAQHNAHFPHLLDQE